MRRAYLLLQKLLPHHLLTALARRWGAIRWRPLKNLQIRGAVRQFGIDLSESESPDPDHYPTFDAFFTRALHPGARQPDPDPRAVLMPADGRVSAVGPIIGDRILQAKGRDYSLAALVGDAGEAAAYAGGSFATVYLQPRNYHRVHMPLAGTLRRTTYVPGRLFSVAPVTVEGIDSVFARNERLVCHFDTEAGPMAVVLVGAMIVAGIETVWSGWLESPRGATPQVTEFPPGRWQLDRFAELGRFHFGSTAIVLFGPDRVRLKGFATGQEVRVGQRLGALAARTAI
ncbi:MAG: phosphatidylserine decarboxylase [Xanthomonadales bacterium]|nr:phosphatidylserine decarboxylase [Xanthomonadales bacterium]